MGPFFRLALATSLFMSVWLNGQAQTDSLKYPIKDRYADKYSADGRNPFDLKDTAYLKQDIRYDPTTKQYYIYEKIGTSYYRKPISMTFEEFWKLRARQMERENFMKRSNTSFELNRKLVRPKLKVSNGLFNRIFGGISDSTGKIKIDIKPQGNVDILAGYQGQNTKNPTLPENARKYGTFDFDMNAQFSVNANIGDKLKLPINYNTLANFDFENQLKLDYAGQEDEIIKKIEAGNISFANKGTLIPGAQALFGLKVALQFGKVFITSAIANQKSSRQSSNYQGGAATQSIEKKLDDYEENRHFLLAQYFRKNYNKVMSTLPVLLSQINILRYEVWVTNRNGSTTESRDVVGLMDLGENRPYNPIITSLTSRDFPDNGSNNLYASITGANKDLFRNPSTASSSLSALGLKPVQDYEKTYARKLNPTEYSFNQQAGFISLNTTLQSDEVLGVAFQYTYNGRTYQVGEFSMDVPSDTARGIQKVLYLKLLKATSQRTNLPIWDLMMKNVYALDNSNIQREGFDLNVLYQEPSGGEKRYLPEGDSANVALLKVFRLDRLNNNNDPQPDGKFDFVEGSTIQSQTGRIIFPLLEPFGIDLDTIAFRSAASQTIKDKYVYYALYDTIKAIAQQNFAQLNRFIMRGTAKSTSNSDIYLNAFNIPVGSVTVMAGGQILTEGVDYSIDYNLGRVSIINQAITNSGIPVSVNFENNAGFGIQNRGFFGTRVDYAASKDLQLGASIQRLSERPFFTKVNYGEDPIKNTMYGVDFSYKKESKGLTRFLDKLPFYSTKAPSTINAYGEAAYLKPGHPPQIGNGEEGLIYLDDFEGTRANIDLRFPFVGWTLASTPADAGFPEATQNNNLAYGYNRSKLSWYQIEPVLQDPQNQNNPNQNRDLLSDPRVRAVDNSELFPQKTVIPGQNQLLTFDMLYSPKQRGPYNYDSRNVNANGDMLNPKSRWGGLMRNIDQTDFETGNVEFLEFWVQDPYTKTTRFPNGYTNPAGGDLFINLGNISEDILKDGRRFYENGLPTPTQPTLGYDSTTVWGKAPINPIQLTQAFSNDEADRPFQDVGFDGLRDDEERLRRKTFLDTLLSSFGANSAVYQAALNDPSFDNFKNYRDASFSATASILSRYKNYNNPQGNSPVNTGGDQVTASTLYPDNEDLNRDNTLSENEEYFEYKIDMRPAALQVGTNYITDRRTIPIKYANGSTGNEFWYQFRIPIRGYTRKVGSIPDFKSIRFMRMYLTNWEDSVNLRFAKMDLVRNQWRNFAFQLTTDGTYTTIPANSTASINTLAVNIEENSSRTPIPYKIPPGIERVMSLATQGVNIQQNEQALSMQVRNLPNGEARGVFKTINFDLRQYKKLSMFIHAESLDNTAPPLTDSVLFAVIRIGQDFLSNYYEIRIPLKITKPSSSASAEEIWPTANNLDFALQDLITMKNRRAAQGVSPTTYFQDVVNGRQYGIFGSPNLAEVRGMLVSVYNPNVIDGRKSVELWINELRLSGLDEQAAYAAIGRVDLQLADLGTMSLSASYRSIGWGNIDQRVNERAKEATTQLDFSTSLQLGKLLPKSLGISIPLYASVSSLTKTPEFDPFDQDVKYKDKLNSASASQKDSIRNAAIQKETTTTINFTNVKIEQKAGKKNKPWSISNFDITYSYIKQKRQSPTVESDVVERHRGVLGYNYAAQPKYYEPFKKIIKTKTHWLDLVKDFNFNLAPSLVSVRMDVNRQFGRFIPRDINTYGKVKVDTTYDKYFVFDRFYAYRWDLTRSFNFDYTATNNARIDELPGAVDTKDKKDYIRRNFWRGGRTTAFDQKVNFTYTLPLAKFPLTDWITARASYSASYRWIASSLLAQSLNQGSFLENALDKNITSEFDFNRLYAKSRWLRALDETPAPKQKAPAPTLNGGKKAGNTKASKAPKDTTSEKALAKLSKKERKEAKKLARQQKRIERQNKPVEMSGAVRALGRILTMVKRGSINYGEVYQSRIPGYLDSTQYGGNNWKTKSPGLGYILGKQPDTSFLNDLGNRGKLTHDTTFNLLFTQSYDQKMSIQMQLEPIKEFTIDLNLDKTYTKNYSELYKDTGITGKLNHLSPYVTGGFSVSFIALNTLFEKYNPNELSETFKRFEANRAIISKRLWDQNPYRTGGADSKGYYTGYGQYSQEVLIPAFIAAYTKKDPNSVALIDNGNPKINANPFRGIKPKPNWRINFTGLTKIPALQKIFSAISLTHAYQAKLGMNSFTSALTFADPFARGFPSFIDTISNNYVPYFLVPNITINESFEPLIGLDVTTTNQLSLRGEYKKSRQLSLSLIDYQLAEIRSSEFTFGFSYRKRGFPLPFKLPKILNKNGGKKLDNDINFKLDVSVRDDVTSNNRLDQGSAIPTSGQKVIKISPSIDYVLNNRINLRLYYDRQRVLPYISSSAETINTRAGLQIRISLAQ